MCGFAAFLGRERLSFAGRQAIEEQGKVDVGEEVWGFVWARQVLWERTVADPKIPIIISDLAPEHSDDPGLPGGAARVPAGAGSGQTLVEEVETIVRRDLVKEPGEGLEVELVVGGGQGRPHEIIHGRSFQSRKGKIKPRSRAVAARGRGRGTRSKLGLDRAGLRRQGHRQRRPQPCSQRPGESSGGGKFGELRGDGRLQTSGGRGFGDWPRSAWPNDGHHEKLRSAPAPILPGGLGQGH